MKIYTKTGDAGETGLFGGPRVRKDAPRIEAYGTVDELNSVLGVVRAEGPPPQIDRVLQGVQNALFDLGADLAAPHASKPAPAIESGQIAELEEAIDRFEATLRPLRQFILPGGTKVAAGLHLARTVCRRAERRVVALGAMPGERVAMEGIVYLNRLSDLLFVMARVANAAAGREDVCWEKAGETERRRDRETERG
jgi:cob(I)alamin adenosyltransferase